ncbi:epoxyqueuosine reductase [Thermodesulfobacteriota bacterium]
MLTQELKAYVKNECGIPLVRIAPVDDLSEKDMQALTKMNNTMAGYTPLYSEDTPTVQPSEFLDNAKALVVIGVNMYFGKRDLPGNPPRGEIMNFYVNADCLAYVSQRTQKIADFLTGKGYTAMSVPTGIPIKMIAARAGLGRYGKNAVIQDKELGSWLGLMVIITDAPLEFDSPEEDDCGECTLCQEACPTGALQGNYTCNIERCLTLHLVNNKGPLPYDIREQAGTILSHCNECLYACPKNANVPVQEKISVPEEQVYPEVAKLVNLTDDAYQELYGGTFLEFMFMDKKYLQRNAAVVLGNLGDPDYIPVLAEALEGQPEELVRGHAAWALGRIGTPAAREILDKRLADEKTASVQEEIRHALEMSA